jgi:hypothetical protein
VWKHPKDIPLHPLYHLSEAGLAPKPSCRLLLRTW